MGISTISMAIFNCYVSSPEGKPPAIPSYFDVNSEGIPDFFRPIARDNSNRLFDSGANSDGCSRVGVEALHGATNITT